MVALCATWKQPDATHFNGFCTNRFRLTTPDEDVHVEHGCDICVTPGTVTDVCNPCAEVPFRFTTTAMTLLKRSWPTSCFSGCGPYPTTDIASDVDIIALPMSRVNRCYWRSVRLTVASGCGCIDGDTSTASLVYAVIQKSVTALSSGTILVFKYDTWLSGTFDGEVAYTGSGSVDTFAVIGHRLTGFATGGDRCYEGSHTLTHTTTGDDTGDDLTHGYWTERKGDGTFDDVTIEAVYD